MDRKEKYVTILLRTLIRRGIITLASSLSGALAIGPYGYVLGPALAVPFDYFTATSEEALNSALPMSATELVIIAVRVGIKLAIDNINTIIEICKDIVRLLKRLFNRGEESVHNARMLLHYAPPN